MNLILADTSGLYSLLAQRDQYHQQSLAFYHGLLPQTKIVVIEYILLETMTLLRARGYSAQAVEFRRLLEQSTLFGLQYSSVLLEKQTFAVFQQYADKEWSYADCALLATARTLDVNTVFSFDTHIDQMGLIRVPYVK
jgi:uncharacterized protein